MQPNETGADVEYVVETDVVTASPVAECSSQVRAGVTTPPEHLEKARKLDADACSASCQSESLTVAAHSARHQNAPDLVILPVEENAESRTAEHHTADSADGDAVEATLPESPVEMDVDADVNTLSKLEVR